jgi:hypothetical protein
MWHDASFTVLFAQKPLAFILSGNDVHPPLHILFMKFWLLFSTSEPWVRASSIIFWILFIVYFWKFAAQISPMARDIALIFLTLSPTMILYSLEPRNYTLGMFLVMAQIYYFYQMSHEVKSWHFWMCFAFSVLMLYTHYYTGLALLIETIIVFFYWQKKEWVVKHFLVCTISAVAAIPLTIYLYLTTQKMVKMWFVSPNYLSYFTSITYQFVPTDALPHIAIFSTTIIVLLISLVVAYITKRPTEEEKHLIAWFFIPLTLMWLLAQFKPFYHHRFFLFFSFALYLLLAIRITWFYDEHIQVSFYAAIILVGLTLFIGTMTMNLWVQHDIQDATAVLKPLLKSGDIIVHSSPFSGTPLKYYLRNYDVENLLVTNLTTRQLFTAGGAVISEYEVFRTFDEVKALNKTTYYMGDEYVNGKTIYDYNGLRVTKIQN